MGQPLPASQTDSYYHPKEGLFTDAEGNQVGFSGSVNESATALEDNYESFMVFNSWDTSPAHLEADPDQVRQALGGQGEGLDRRAGTRGGQAGASQVPHQRRLPSVRLESPSPRTNHRRSHRTIDATQKERIVFQFLRDAPHLLNAHRLGMATSTVQPWPHQIRVSDAVIERFPHSFMLCDEVGLGKTVEAGLAIRQLLLSGRVQRALILVPKSVLVQWQEELYEKFVLNIPRYDGNSILRRVRQGD